MFSVANTVPVGPKVLPAVLVVGGATVAGSYVRSQSRNFGSYTQSNNIVENEPVRKPLFEHCAPESRSKFFNLVLDSVFA